MLLRRYISLASRKPIVKNLPGFRKIRVFTLYYIPPSVLSKTRHVDDVFIGYRCSTDLFEQEFSTRKRPACSMSVFGPVSVCSLSGVVFGHVGRKPRFRPGYRIDWWNSIKQK